MEYCKIKEIKCTAVTLLVPIYIFTYTLIAIWLLIDGWINNFSSLFWLWSIANNEVFPSQVFLLMFTIVGAILGSSLFGIITFHKYKAIEKSFDPDHLWGFFFSPLLAVIVGILVFAILQSGLVVLSGQVSNATSTDNATLGYLAIGGITGYNWDVFVKKLQELSENLLNTKPTKNSTINTVTETASKSEILNNEVDTK